jgi:DegV family protein with EDD domain
MNMPKRVMVVTDSTCNLPASVIQGLPIEVVPLHIIFNTMDIYLDGINITPQEFYNRLRDEKPVVSTSQPTPAALAQRYSQLADEGYDIISVHISSKLSGTINSAEQAKKTIRNATIEIVDTFLASLPLGYVTLQVARAAAQGANLSECKNIAVETSKRCSAVFIVDTLEYLHRGGRIGGASAFFGTAFNIKPVLELKNGLIDAAGRVRTLNKAMDYILEVLENKIGPGVSNLHLSAMHAESPENAAILLEKARAKFNVANDSMVTDVTPVIGAHVGPGTIGIAYFAEN